MPKQDVIGKYMFLFLFLATAFLSFKILLPFFSALFASALLVFIFHSMYDKLYHKLKNKTLASTISVTIVILVIIIPFSLLISSLVNETSVIFNTISTNSISEMIPTNFNVFGNNITISNYIIKGLDHFSTFIVNNASKILEIISWTMLNTIILFFSLFYFFIYGRHIILMIENLLPLKKHKKKIVLDKFYEYIFATLYGTIIVALIQGSIGGFMFWFFGISNPVFWGFVMFVFAFLPVIGAPVIWVPVAINQFILGNIWVSLWMFLIGTFIIGTIDNILKPKIVGDAANVNPLIVLLGALGGLNYMGVIGLFAGPMIIIIFITLLEIYEKGHHL